MRGSHRPWAIVGGALGVVLLGGSLQIPADAAGIAATSTALHTQAAATNAQDERKGVGRSTAHGSLTVATWNIGRGTLADARKVLSRSPVLALQEAGDRSKLIRALDRSRYRVIKGSGRPGQSSTPLVFDPKVLRLVRPSATLMAPRQRVGRGTGPDRMKAKWLIGGRFVHRHTGTRLFIGTTHLVAGQSRQRRARVAIRHVRHVVSRLRRVAGIRLVMGDFNTRPGSKVLVPLRAAGWTSDQFVGRRLDTHGTWASDHVWWRAARGLRLVEHHTIRNRSDHDALLATLTLPSR